MDRSPLATTRCSCETPGWCQRHGCHKPEMWWYLCRHNVEWFNLWESGLGPGQQMNVPAAAGLPRCRHRGLEADRIVPCELCGGKRNVPIYACTLYGECAEHRVGTRTEWERQLRCCLACADYQPDSSDGTLPDSA